MSRSKVFSDWLLGQTARRDALGDFARVTANAIDAPTYAYRPRLWVKWLRTQWPDADAAAIVDSAFWQFAKEA